MPGTSTELAAGSRLPTLCGRRRVGAMPMAMQAAPILGLGAAVPVRASLFLNLTVSRDDARGRGLAVER